MSALAVTDAAVTQWEGMCHKVVGDYYAPGLGVDDLLQEARIGAFKGLRDYRPERGHLTTFMSLCIRRQVITAVKGATAVKHQSLNESVRILRDPEAGAETDAVDILSAPDTPPRLLARREELHQLGTRIRERLTLVECQCILGLLNGESYEEIGARHGLGFKAVDNATQRARRKLEATTHGLDGCGYSCPRCGGATRKRSGRGRPPKCVLCRTRETRRRPA